MRFSPTAYSPYGHSEHSRRPHFTGERCDSNSCTYALGMGLRRYSPGLMRFHSPDLLSPFGRGGLNAYAYCAGNPIDFIDPSGQTLLANIQARRQQMGLIDAEPAQRSSAAKSRPAPTRRTESADQPRHLAISKTKRKLRFDDNPQILEYEQPAPIEESKRTFFRTRAYYLNEVGHELEIKTLLESQLQRLFTPLPSTFRLKSLKRAESREQLRHYFALEIEASEMRLEQLRKMLDKRAPRSAPLR